MPIERTHISEILIDVDSITEDISLERFTWEQGCNNDLEFNTSSVDSNLTPAYFDASTCLAAYDNLCLVDGKELDKLESEDQVLGMDQRGWDLINSTIMNTLDGLAIMGVKDGEMMTVDIRMLSNALAEGIKQSLYDDNIGSVTKYIDL